MNDDSLGVIRRGWPEAAATLAPHVLGLNDLFERRLEEATRTGKIDEGSLMTIVDAATQMAVEAGAADVANSLGNRLRRTVYEYLLSLDATSQQENSPTATPGPDRRWRSALIGADEIAAMGRAANLEAAASSAGEAGQDSRAAKPTAQALPSPDVATAGSSDGSSPSAAPDPSPTDSDPGQRFHVFRRGGGGDQGPLRPGQEDEWSPPPPPPPANRATDADDAAPDPATLAPGFGFHIGDPSDLVGQAPPPRQKTAAQRIPMGWAPSPPAWRSPIAGIPPATGRPTNPGHPSPIHPHGPSRRLQRCARPAATSPATGLRTGPRRLGGDTIVHSTRRRSGRRFRPCNRPRRIRLFRQPGAKRSCAWHRRQ